VAAEFARPERRLGEENTLAKMRLILEKFFTYYPQRMPDRW